MTCKFTAVSALGTALCVGLCAISAASADVPTTAVDVSAYRDKLTVLSDGKGHFIAVTPIGNDERAVFYGDGKVFYQQRLVGMSRNGDKWDHVFIDPRLPVGGRDEGTGFLIFDGKQHRVECDKRVTNLNPVAEAEAKTVLSSAQFLRSPRKFRPYALARDERGSYYYVDRGNHPEDKERFRVFAGPKGNMKPQQMKSIASDPSGDVFSTKTGTLRLVLNKEPQELKWISGKKTIGLVRVPLDFNTMIATIYNEFGVYTGERLGTPCDDL
ncbi:MAG: hypothetical protein JNM40_20740 [Myxococcales bacterium]|nr:hypothetical protein [Myxococcales bacterium]